MPTTTVHIPGMHCVSCSALIKDISTEFPEIINVSVDLGAKKVTIEHDDTFNMGKWKAEIEGLGNAYKVHPAS